MYSIYLNIFEVYILVAVHNLIIWHNGKKKDWFDDQNFFATQ